MPLPEAPTTAQHSPGRKLAVISCSTSQPGLVAEGDVPELYALPEISRERAPAADIVGERG